MSIRIVFNIPSITIILYHIIPPLVYFWLIIPSYIFSNNLYFLKCFAWFPGIPMIVPEHISKEWSFCLCYYQQFISNIIFQLGPNPKSKHKSQFGPKLKPNLPSKTTHPPTQTFSSLSYRFCMSLKLSQQSKYENRKRF